MMKVEIKGIFVKTLLIILAISFVLFGIINFFSGVGHTNILKIDNEKISVNRFAKFLNERRNQYYNSDLGNSDLDFINSQEFVRLALSDFASETLFYVEVKKLNLQQPKESVLNDIYNEPMFRDENGSFDIKIFKAALARSGLTEDGYINYLSMFNSRNSLVQLLTLQNLSNRFILNPLVKLENKYVVADVIKVDPNNLKFDFKKPTNEEIEEYYNSNKSEFIIPEEKVISYIDVDLSKYKDEESKTKLSELEDLILSSKNIDEVAKAFNVKKETIVYSEKKKDIPQDLNVEILQYGPGTFSDLIYKDNNMYKVYFIEEILPTKTLSLAEATPEITNILLEKSRKNNELFVLDKMITQMKNNNIEKIISRNSDELVKNETIYRNNLFYPDEFINELYGLSATKSFTKPIFDAEHNIYLIGYLKEIREVQQNDNRFVSPEALANKINRSYNNSVLKLFQKYLFDTNKIIVNNKLLDSLE